MEIADDEIKNNIKLKKNAEMRRPALAKNEAERDEKMYEWNEKRKKGRPSEARLVALDDRHEEDDTFNSKDEGEEVREECDVLFHADIITQKTRAEAGFSLIDLKT